MQTIITGSPTISAAVSALAAQRAANSYLLTTVAADIETASPILIPDDLPIWRMRVQPCQRQRTATLGVIDVDARTGVVAPLTAEQIEDMRDRLQAETGTAKAILRPAAQITANGYLSDYVSLFAKTERPVLITGDRPLWRATVFLRLRGHGRVCDLGVIDVDAQTGEVMPLSQKQLQAMRKRAHDAAERTTLAAATPG
jgi:hypothetical protein